MNRFLSLNDLTSMPTPQWLIEGLFEVGSIVTLTAPPANFKSFMATDWMLCMASGRDWNEKSTVPCNVLYCLGEGRASLLKRVQAWVQHHKLNELELSSLNDRFRVSFDVPQLASKISVDNLLAQLNMEKYEPNVICIDTFARSFVGLDENSQRDTGMWIEQAERLRSMGYTVIFLHHSKRNTEFGIQYRGSSAIMGAVDTGITMVRDFNDNTVKMDVTKQKDHDEGDPMFFQRTVVGTGYGEGSMVLTPTIKVDSRFTEEAVRRDKMVDELISDKGFKSDSARATFMAENLKMTFYAAQSRIRDRKRELRLKNDPDDSENPIDISGKI